MERHDLTLASTRVHVIDLCPRKASCLRSLFHLLHRLPSCGLDTLPKLLDSSICIELMMVLTPTISRVSPSMSLILTSALSVLLFYVVMVTPPLDFVLPHARSCDDSLMLA
ncbi:hypothetical protein BHE74_00049789 [Ensete ventricosum]|nr:hypothetical protein BHE74_00049789 [Ensete ventricosum]